MWKRDWFLGLILSLLFAFAAGSELLQGLERKAYDLGVRWSQRTPSDRVAVIAIDDRSIANIGRWPWPREVHARLLDRLTGAGAKVVGYTAFFVEPQTDPGLVHIQRLWDYYRERLATAGAAEPALAGLGRLLEDARRELDQDAKLAGAIRRNGRTVLALAASLGEPAGRPDAPLPDYVQASLLDRLAPGETVAGPEDLPLPAAEVLLPLPDFGAAAAGIGHLNFNLDPDGGARTLPLALRYHGALFPAMALTVVARYLNLQGPDVQVLLGRGIQAGGLFIPTDSTLQMRPFFYSGRDGRPAFEVDSFYDVLSGALPADKYRQRIVLVGATASGVGSTQVTPVSPAMAPVITLAHMVSSILRGDYIATPPWSGQAAWGALALTALYLILVLPRVGAAAAGTLTLVLLAALLGIEFYGLTQEAVWLPLMVPAALLLSGHLLLVSKRYLTTERGKLAADASSAESNRMLGLAFQNQGQLDMAFEKFRKVPLDDSMLEVLYNLGLDFERKRQFTKAAAVFEYAAGHNPRFRDLQERIQRNRRLGETVMLGAGAGPQATLVLGQEDVQKPMLGRYQVEKELGKGAMGVVYQGRDPKINRVVAIKTLALSQEFEADELEEVKARFFREAETAGRLNHPNIVTIYDAGEEHDLAYIAMEFLQGENLSAYTRSDHLLPVAKVLDIVMQVGEALDYAHQRQVVHRDIKPANIMYEPGSDRIKVTDFGIARITDASRTKTGVILGTPSYMSPEQLIGRKVDGRSDIFSLGVMTFQLLTGRLPFQGDSLATLTYQIANEPAPDLTRLRPELDPCIARVVARCLEKSAAARWQSAGEFGAALRACRQAAGGG